MTDVHQFSRAELEQYVWNMPDELAEAVRAIKSKSGTTTYELRERNHEMYLAVRSIWLDLAEQLPGSLFGDRSAADVFDSTMDQRVPIYRALQEPGGPGTGGTIAAQMVSEALFEDAKQFARIAAERLIGLGVNAAALDAWRRKWADVDVTA
jgi:hypothetical protein